MVNRYGGYVCNNQHICCHIWVVYGAAFLKKSIIKSKREDQWRSDLKKTPLLLSENRGVFFIRVKRIGSFNEIRKNYTFSTRIIFVQIGRYSAGVFFQPDRPRYLAFNDSVKDKSDIKTVIEANPAVERTISAHRQALEQWWHVARNEFAKLERVNNGNGGGRKMPDVRHELLTTLKEKLVPLLALDEFKSAGVFVNWWQQIRYDLKTIVSTGWPPLFQMNT